MTRVIDVGGGYFWPSPDIPKGKIFEKPKEKEMCIPKLSPEEMAEEDNHLYQYYSQEIMNEIYKEEVFAQLEKDLQEEESLVVLDPFVRDMCSYYKIPQDNYVMWQHYYDYIIEETAQVYAAKGRDVPKNYLTEVQNNFNNEMLKYVKEKKAEVEEKFGSHMDDFWKKSLAKPLWNAIEKHK